MRLQGKNAIITGASSGIGKAIAVKFAAEGANVVLTDKSENPREGGASTQEIIKQNGGQAISLLKDVSKWEDVDEVVETAVREFGRLDIMVNNAGFSIDKSLLETDEDLWNLTMDVNLKGVFYYCKRAVQQMLTQEVVNEARGRIINITSQHGMISAPNSFAYGVSKSGVVYMTRQIAADYAKEYIICNAVAPGKIITGKSGHAASEETIRYSQSRTPMPRLGKPEDVANAALFLAGDEATYITGVNLLVDGGWMAC